MYSIEKLKTELKNKRVFVTGFTGFKGAYLCVLLKYLGAKVYGYALKEESKSLFAILKKEVGKKINNYLVDDYVYSDIRDYTKLKKFVDKVKPEYVIHMAAQPLVLLSYKDTRYTYDVNVMGTVNLLEALKGSKASILNVTTDKVYDNNDIKNYAFKESDRLCGHDPYANSKSCSELATFAYKKAFDMHISTARAGNVIGGGDFSENRIIPDAYRAICKNDVLNVRNPFSIRPYEFVLEPLFIYINILVMQKKNRKYEGNYNIGPDKKMCLTTKELVEKFYTEWEIIDKKVARVKYGTDKSGRESKFLKLDNSLIKKVFGYKEIYSLDDMIKYTALIYKQILYKKPVLQTILAIVNDYK